MRIVDLRMGDEILKDGRWQQVLSMEVFSERVLTERLSQKGSSVFLGFHAARAR